MTSAPPHVRSLAVVGELSEGSVLELEAEYVGGRQGASRVQWYREAEWKGMEASATGIAMMAMTASARTLELRSPPPAGP